MHVQGLIDLTASIREVNAKYEEVLASVYDDKSLERAAKWNSFQDELSADLELQLAVEKKIAQQEGYAHHHEALSLEIDAMDIDEPALPPKK